MHVGVLGDFGDQGEMFNYVLSSFSGLYTTFIFQKPDPDAGPPLTTPLLLNRNQFEDEVLYSHYFIKYFPFALWNMAHIFLVLFHISTSSRALLFWNLALERGEGLERRRRLGHSHGAGSWTGQDIRTEGNIRSRSTWFTLFRNLHNRMNQRRQDLNFCSSFEACSELGLIVSFLFRKVPM